jgi:hypothetical protein
VTHDSAFGDQLNPPPFCARQMYPKTGDGGVAGSASLVPDQLVVAGPSRGRTNVD